MPTAAPSGHLVAAATAAIPTVSSDIVQAEKGTRRGWKGSRESSTKLGTDVRRRRLASSSSSSLVREARIEKPGGLRARQRDRRGCEGERGPRGWWHRGETTCRKRDGDSRASVIARTNRCTLLVSRWLLDWSALCVASAYVFSNIECASRCSYIESEIERERERNFFSHYACESHLHDK